MPPAAEASSDPHLVRRACERFLLARPVEHNVALTILHERLARPSPGRYWWIVDDGAVIGYAFRSPATFKAGVTPMPRPAIDALVARVSADAPDLPGVIGEAATAAAFAGRWSEALGVGAVPYEGQRIYRLDRVRGAAVSPGKARVASPGDVPTLLEWRAAFDSETGAGGGTPDVEAAIRRSVDDGRLHLWSDGEPVAMAGVTGAIAGVARVGPVYTPPPRRGHGYASALVAHASERALTDGAKACMLYTRLDNPVSNAIYRRIGYECCSEVLTYRFGS